MMIRCLAEKTWGCLGLKDLADQQLGFVLGPHLLACFGKTGRAVRVMLLPCSQSRTAARQLQGSIALSLQPHQILSNRICGSTGLQASTCRWD